jgi:hypothetical protein
VSTPPAASGDALAIALAEYASLSDLQRSIREQSAARFNFFLVITTAVVAVTASQFTSQPTRAVVSATASLGILLLVMGVSIFFRQVEFSSRGQRYAAAQDAVRTFLAEQAPQLEPYLFMPTLSDRGVIGRTYRTHSWRRDVVSLAGTVALFNSTILLLDVALFTGNAAGAILAFVVVFALQIGYLQRVGQLTRAEIDVLVAVRGLREQPLVPSDSGGVGE